MRMQRADYNERGDRIGATFDFDGTESGFLKVATMNGAKDNYCFYLGDTLIYVYWDEAKQNWCANDATTCEPLSSILAKHRKLANEGSR